MTRSHIIKRSVVIAGHATSVSLEPEFWDALKNIAVEDSLSVAALIRQIDDNIPSSNHRNLSSAIRVYILRQAQEKGA
ncbi:MAG: ribbon-helix-helix domain-containing protein [Candidatus Paracaedibacter sp.]